MGLSDGEKFAAICSVVLMQYQSVTDICCAFHS